MGIFDGQTAILFREDASGQRVYAPFGTWGGVYQVSNVAAERIRRHVKVFWFAALVIVVGLQITLGWRYNLLALPVVLAAYFGMAGLHVRQLPRLPLSAREFPAISRPELERRYSHAIGSPVLAILTAFSAALTAIGIWMVIKGAGVQAWFVLLFFGACAVSLFRQWRRARS
jgi:hypothetical protein